MATNSTTKIVREQGGDTLTVNTGGEIDLDAGGKIDNVDASELATLDAVTPGTAAASKALVLDSNKDYTGVRNSTQTGFHNSATWKNDGITMSPLKWVDVTVSAALLDGGGHVDAIAAVAGDQYKVRDVILVGGGTNFGAGGNRLISLTDGTTVYTTIANADIESAPAASLRWGDTKVPFLTNKSNVPTVVGTALKFEYSGGTTDHTTGSIVFSVCVEKVA